MGAQQDPLNYPVTGASYLMSHPNLWKYVICLLCSCLSLSLVIMIILFATAFSKQAESFNSLIGGDEDDVSILSYALSGLAVFLETFVLTTLVMKKAIKLAQRKIWLAIMRDKECYDTSWTEPPEFGCEFGLSFAFVLKFVTLPLNLVPIFGTLFFSVLNATLLAWEYNEFYFSVLNLSDRAQKERVLGGGSLTSFNLENGFFRFGFMATMLEMVPIAGPTFFTLGNACGVALWNCDLEREKGGKGPGPAP